MNRENIDSRDFAREFIFSFSRSSGPGGQNVNKVNTRVELRFNVQNSACLDEGEKELVFKKLASKINKEGELILVSQSERTQLQNKEKVSEKFFVLILKALTPPKKRRPTYPSKASKEKRLEKKRLVSEKKQIRRKTDI